MRLRHCSLCISPTSPLSLSLSPFLSLFSFSSLIVGGYSTVSFYPHDDYHSRVIIPHTDCDVTVSYVAQWSRDGKKSRLSESRRLAQRATTSNVVLYVALRRVARRAFALGSPTDPRSCLLLLLLLLTSRRHATSSFSRSCTWPRRLVGACRPRSGRGGSGAYWGGTRDALRVDGVDWDYSGNAVCIIHDRAHFDLMRRFADLPETCYTNNRRSGVLSILLVGGLLVGGLWYMHRCSAFALCSFFVHSGDMIMYIEEKTALLAKLRTL